MKIKTKFLISLAFVLLTACGDHLTADQISKMTEEQIKQVTPDQIGKMTPGELETFNNRKSYFVSERTKAELKSYTESANRHINK